MSGTIMNNPHVCCITIKHGSKLKNVSCAVAIHHELAQVRCSVLTGRIQIYVRCICHTGALIDLGSLKPRSRKQAVCDMFVLKKLDAICCCIVPIVNHTWQWRYDSTQMDL